MNKFIAACLFVFLLQCFSQSELKIIAHPEVFQGRCFIVFVSDKNEILSAKIHFNNKTYQAYPYEDGLRAIIPIPPEFKVGVYPIDVVANYKNNMSEKEGASILVSKQVFPKTSFWLKPSKKKLLAPNIMEKEWPILESILVAESPNKLWSGLFSKPVQGITTMPYGTREYVNNKKRGQHRGWDFRAAMGTKVFAPNSGKIVYSGFLRAFGGTIIIDHGQGINTIYFHLSKILVENGQIINKGDLLALTGNTGVSSGPHLHWGMSVHNVRVDPKQWVMTVMP